MSVGGRLPRPVLKFGGGTSIYPFEGLSMGLGPLRGPGRIRLGAVYHAQLGSRFRRFMDNLIYGHRSYVGMEELLNVRVDVEVAAFRNLREAEEEILPSMLGSDVVISTVPDEILRWEDEDYYVPLKQDLSLLGMPSQMVRFSTLRWRADDPYVMFNFAINLYSKAGGVPWGLAEDLATDAVIGVDVASGYLAVTLFTSPGSPYVSWSADVNLDVEVASRLREPILATLRAASESVPRGPLRSVAFYRDGVAHWSEVEAIRDALSAAADRGILARDHYYTVMEIRKRIVPRLLRSGHGRLYNPEKGIYVWIDKDSLLMATTGYPERPLPEYAGLVRPVLVRQVDTSNWDREFLDVAKDVYWLSQLHWGSAFTTPRIPITTLYSHKICRFLSLGVHPPEEFENRLWFL